MGVDRRSESKGGGSKREVVGGSFPAEGDTLLLRTKLQRPPVAPDILPRARLLDQLNEWRQRTTTLISAPAGYGKSTLASRWMAARDTPSGWVSLDESDSDLRTFLRYVLAAIKPLFPKIELRSETLLEAAELPSASVLASHLLNDLYQVSEPFILVLDDYHHVRGTLVHDLLTEVLTYPPQAMHLVLLTRRDPPLPLSRLRGRGQLTEIRAADLRFTPEEAAGFLNRILDVPVDDATAALLEEKVEGWATGLRLTGLYLRGHADLMSSLKQLGGSSVYITEYLVAEVLSRQTPEIAGYLTETSILDRFSASLCEAVHLSGVEGKKDGALGAQRFIEWLVETNLFVIPLDDQGIWFRYHHLFREFLQTALRKQRSPEAIARLHLEASGWFEDEGLLDEAIRHALAAGDTEAAVRLVIRHRHDLINRSQFHRLYRWLDLLSAEAVVENPLLVTTRGLLAIELGRDADMYACMQQAQRMLATLRPESAEHAALKGELAALAGVVDIVMGNSSSALTQAQCALRQLPAQAMLARSLAFGVIAGARQMEGNFAQGLKAVTDALAESVWPTNGRARMWVYLAIVNFLEANLAETQFAAHECLRTIGDSQFPHTKNFARYFLGAVHYLRNELPEAEPYLLCVLNDRFVTSPSYVAHAGFALASIHLSRGCPAEAEQVVDLLSDHFREIKHIYGSSATEAFRVELALRQGKVDEARRLSMGVDFNPRPPLWLFYVPQLTAIKLLLAAGAAGGLEEARTRLDDLEEKMRRLNRRCVRINILALQSLVYHKLGEEAAAREKLRTAVDLARPGGFIRNFVDLGGPMAPLLAYLRESSPGDWFVERLAAACAVESEEATARLVQPPMRPSPGKVPAAAQALTPRERELLVLLAQGLSNKETGARLHIATETVKTHLRSVYRKLGADGRRAALRKAGSLGLITRYANEGRSGETTGAS